MINKSILAEAAEIRAGVRATDYGDAVASFNKVATIATEMCGFRVTPSDCCKVLMAVKMVRQSYKHKRDNLVDLAGYTDILHLLEEDELKDHTY